MNGQKLAIKTIKNKIEYFISSGIYTDLEEFIKDNPDLETFQEKTKLNNSLKRIWGYQVTEEDFQILLEELKIEIEKKLRIQKESLTTVQANGKEITTYTDGEKEIVIDNSYSNMSVEEQLPLLQEKYSNFRQNGDVNTSNMMEFMKEEIKPEPIFTSISDVNMDALSGESSEIAQVATTYQDSSDNVVQVDFENGLIIDDGKIRTVEKREDGYGVYSPDISEPDDLEQDVQQVQKAPQKTLQKNTFYKQAGFSDTLILALLTGMLIGLVFLNIYIKIS